MDTRKRRIVIAVMLMISIGNYARLINNNIRPIQFLSIFVIGALSALLIRSIADEYRNK